MFPLRVYMASRIANAPMNLEIARALRADGIEVALPQEFCPAGIAHDHYAMDVFRRCLHQMQQSHAALVNLDSCGCDSSWECGWFNGMDRPVIGVVVGTSAFLKDFMLKGGLSAVATPNPLLYQRMAEDPTLEGIRLLRLENLEGLPNFVREVVPSTF